MRKALFLTRFIFIFGFAVGFGQQNHERQIWLLDIESIYGESPIAMNHERGFSALKSKTDPIPHLPYANEEIDISRFTIYPNPTKGILNVHFPELEEKVTVNIIDLLRKQVVKIEYFNTDQIEVNENLQPGMYLVKISTEKSSETVRMEVE